MKDEYVDLIIQLPVQVLHYSLPCCSSWLFMSASAGIPTGPSLHDAWSAYPAHKIHSYKHLNILVMTFTNLLLQQSVIKQGRGVGRYIELHVR